MTSTQSPHGAPQPRAVELPWWRSRTIWSGIATILTSIAAFFGIMLPYELLLGAIMSLVGLAAGVGTIAGRTLATQPIARRKQPPNVHT